MLGRFLWLPCGQAAITASPLGKGRQHKRQGFGGELYGACWWKGARGDEEEGEGLVVSVWGRVAQEEVPAKSAPASEVTWGHLLEM